MKDRTVKQESGVGHGKGVIGDENEGIGPMGFIYIKEIEP
jgi:hypothetical protein